MTRCVYVCVLEASVCLCVLSVCVSDSQLLNWKCFMLNSPKHKCSSTQFRIAFSLFGFNHLFLLVCDSQFLCICRYIIFFLSLKIITLKWRNKMGKKNYKKPWSYWTNLSKNNKWQSENPQRFTTKTIYTHWMRCGKLVLILVSNLKIDLFRFLLFVSAEMWMLVKVLDVAKISCK